MFMCYTNLQEMIH